MARTYGYNQAVAQSAAPSSRSVSLPFAPSGSVGDNPGIRRVAPQHQIAVTTYGPGNGGMSRSAGSSAKIGSSGFLGIPMLGWVAIGVGAYLILR